MDNLERPQHNRSSVERLAALSEQERLEGLLALSLFTLAERLIENREQSGGSPKALRDARNQVQQIVFNLLKLHSTDNPDAPLSRGQEAKLEEQAQKITTDNLEGFARTRLITVIKQIRRDIKSSTSTPRWLMRLINLVRAERQPSTSRFMTLDERELLAQNIQNAKALRAYLQLIENVGRFLRR
jgi:hypothetical protein